MLNKFYLTFLLTILSVGILRAQVQIDFSDMAKVGDGYIYAVKYFRQGELTVSQLDQSGWNVTQYKPESFDTVRFYNKNRSRYGNLFPNSEIVKFQTKKNMQFLTIDSTRMRMQGIINDYLGLKASVVLVFPTDLQVYKFPLRKGISLKDSISKKFVSSYGLTQFADSVRVDLDMSTDSEFDTCATVVTPTDSYQALREKNTIYKKMVAYKNSHLMGWTPAPEFSSKITTVYYRWYAKHCGIPVLEAEADTKGNVTAIRYQYRQPMEVTLDKVDVNCKGKRTGKVIVNVLGGTPDYKYRWSNGMKTKTLDSIPAGTYTVDVTDSKGTKITKSITVNEPDKELSLKIDYRNIRCYGDHDATLKADVTGGTSPYYIVWSDDTEADNISGKGTGVYGCIVRDAQRCFVWDSVEITAPQTPLTFSPKVEHSPCNGQPRGALNFDFSGGDAPYTFSIDGKPAEQRVDNLMAGTYNMKISDKWGCEIERTAEIRQPEKPLDATAEVHHVTCSGGSNGSIQLKVLGGSPGYTYSWNNGAHQKDLSNIGAGVYNVTVSDSHKCTIDKSYTIIAPAAILKLDYTVHDVTCKGGSDGSISAKGLGGVAPYSISFNNKQKSVSMQNIKAGNYDVKLTDYNNCSVIETVIVSEPETQPVVDIDVLNSPCHGKNMGSLTANVSGGKAPYRFSWSNGVATAANKDIPAGNYTVKVFDSDNCIAEKSAVVTQPDKELWSEVEVSGTTCFDSDDGKYSIHVTGGVPAYSYSVSDGSEVPTQQNMKPGPYSVTITDNAGCVTKRDFNIPQMYEIKIEANLKKPSSESKPDGSAELTISGGTYPYRIHWNDGFTEPKRKNMSVGEYYITITDKNGCKAEKEIIFE